MVLSKALDEDEKWHTREWYKKNFGVDPLKLGLPFIEVNYPDYSSTHHSSGPLMLWKEEDVLPYKKEAKMAKPVKKKTKSALIRKRAEEIVRRIREIEERIRELHYLKEDCRLQDRNYNPKLFWKYGIQHCEKCEAWSNEQEMLRDERKRLFAELLSLPKRKY